MKRKRKRDQKEKERERELTGDWMLHDFLLDKEKNKEKKITVYGSDGFCCLVKKKKIQKISKKKEFSRKKKKVIKVNKNQLYFIHFISY